jgi:hypothetical protein
MYLVHAFNLRKSIGLMAALIASAAASLAGTIVDTGTPPLGQPGGPALYPYQGLAGQFAISQNTTITSVEGFMSFGIGGGSMTVSIFGDNNSNPFFPIPDNTNTLHSGSFNATSSVQDAWMGLSGLNWNLTAGTYWLGFTTNDAWGWMPDSAPSPLSGYAFTSGGNWNSANYLKLGIRINGDPTTQSVPEGSSSLVLLGLAFGGLALFRRCFR